MLGLKWNTGYTRALWMEQKRRRRVVLTHFCAALGWCQLSSSSGGSAPSILKPPASLLLLQAACWDAGFHARSPCRNHHRHRGRQRSRTTSFLAPASSRTSPLMEGDSSFPKWRLFEEIAMRDYIALGPHLRKKPAHQGDAFARQSQQQQQSVLLPPNYTSDEEWLSASLELATSLGIDPTSATESQHRRVFHLYLPVLFWLRQLLLSGHHRPNDEIVRSAATLPPLPREVERCNRECGQNALVVGISAPQGCGKSSLVEEMRRMLVKAKHPCSVLSIDDFYLTGAEQDALAAAHPSNPLLQVRGNAGTHDLALGLRTIRSLKYGVEQTSSSAAGRDTSSSFRIPRYDKSARGGRGDRAPEKQWSAVPVMPEIVLLEGWMLGFEALPEESPLLDADDKKANQRDGSLAGSGGGGSLRVVNAFLRDYRELYDEVDAWLVLKTADPEMVFEWRAEAERRMRDAGRPGMSEKQVRDFCARYMPAYRAYLPGLYDRAASAGRRRGDLGRYRDYDKEGENGGEGMKEAFLIEVGRDRNPVVDVQDGRMV